MNMIKIDYFTIIPDNFTGIIEYPDGKKEWRKEGKLHREDGPAFYYSRDYKEWYKEGKCHRIGGSAVYYSRNYEEWWIEGKRHRTDGPACEYPDGNKHWYVEGRIYPSHWLRSLINTSICLGKEKGKHNLEWLKFLHEDEIKEFPIVPGMEYNKDFKCLFDQIFGASKQ